MAVYVIQAKGTPRYKIGYARDIKRRIRRLQTGCPYPIGVVNCIEDGDRDLEAMAHDIWAAHRVQGEWFELPEGAVSYLQGADSSAITRLVSAAFLLKKDLSGVFPPSKVEEIRSKCLEVVRGAGA